tara:strand:- start:752 stop:1603 length:852 start_codon:yes stop_codon:yes gene_type:complete
MSLLNLQHLRKLKGLKLAVVGHVEWVRFLLVDDLPKEGLISHSNKYIDQPAGGGALAAVQMRTLINSPVHFFTSLGKDETGEKSYKILENLGLSLKVAWRDKPTRQGISFVDSQGERAITVIGERLQPTAKDPLPWNELSKFDAVFITAGDSELINICRRANLLIATPRVGIKTIQKANVQLDLLVGSGLDPGEKYNPEELNPKPKFRIATQGAAGGEVWPGGRFKSSKLTAKLIDTYGCGDKFAAGVTTGLAAKWNINEAIKLGASCGAECATYFGPYPNLN